MDAAAQKVEENLSETSRNCNSRLMERKARNLKIFEERVGAAGMATPWWGSIYVYDKGTDKNCYVPQSERNTSSPHSWLFFKVVHLWFQDFCIKTKVLLVSSQPKYSSSLDCSSNHSSRRYFEPPPPQSSPLTITQGSVPLLESLKTQRASLNILLARHIDLLLSTPSISTDYLTSTFTSFSLLKTSSPTEVLRHFLFIRSSAISSLVKEQSSSEAILKALALFNRTLQDAEAVFPKRLSESLVVLKSRSLFTDPDVLGVTELGLDVNGRWLPEEISGFVPWVRHDDLERSRVIELVKIWAERELGTLNVNLEKSLAAITEMEELVKLRIDMLNLWRAGRKGRRQFIQNGERFREAVGDRMAEVLRGKSAALQKIGEKIADVAQSLTSEDVDSTSLWSPTLLTMELTNGGFEFKGAVQSRVHGKNSSIKDFRQDYNIWLSDIAESALVVRGLRNPNSASGQDDDDDFDVEEEKLQEGLEDSEIAEKEIIGALENDYKELEKTLDGLVDACFGEGEEEQKGNFGIPIESSTRY